MEFKILLVSLLGSVALTQLAAQTASPVAVAAGVDSFAWRRAEGYVAPDFEAFFPDDPEGVRKLDELWKRLNKESLSWGEQTRTESVVSKAGQRGARDV